MKKYLCSILLASLILLSLSLLSLVSADLTGVTLVSPADNTAIKGTWTFNATVIGNATNVTFRWWNATNATTSSWQTLCTNDSTAGAGPFTCSASTLSIPDGKDYIFNAIAMNATVNVTDDNTGIDVDNTLPSIELTSTSPSDGKNMTSTTVKFEYRPSDNLGLPLSCSLFINGANKSTATNIPNDSIKSFSISGLSRGTTYIWYINCTDTALNVRQSVPRSFTIEEMNYCDVGEQGSDITIDLKKPTEGSDYHPGDNITVEVKVTNTGSDDRDITVAAALYDLDDDSNLIDTDQSETIANDHSSTFYLNLTVPMDVDTSHNFAVYAKAYDNEKDQCQEDSVSIDTTKESHNIVIEKLVLSPTTAGCGDIFNIVMELGNAGSHDEDSINVDLSSDMFSEYNRTLSLNEGDESNSLNFQFAVPTNASEKNHVINVRVYYDYINGAYGEWTDNSLNLKVQGGECFVPAQDTSFSVNQGSEAFIGSSFTTKVAVTNTGNVKTNYTVNASGYEGWATLESISPSILSLDAGSTGYAYVTLKPSTDVAGTNTFTVKVNFGSTTREQAFSVDVKTPSEPASGWDQFVFEMKSNWQWSALIILLVVIVIILAVFLARQGARQRSYRFQPSEIRLRTMPSQSSRLDERNARPSGFDGQKTRKRK